MTGRRKNLFSRNNNRQNNNNGSPILKPLSVTTNNQSLNTPSAYLSPSHRFNPRLILSQIIALQSIHYFVLSLMFQINHVLFGTSISLDRIFTAKYLNVWSAEGWVDGGAIVSSSLFGALLLAAIVEKSKKCLDFSVTLFFIHLSLCSLYNGAVPTSWDWWITHIFGMILMVLLGEYVCSRLEMRDIPLL